MVSKISAAVLVDTKKPLMIVNDISLPKLKPGQVLVKIKYSGLCHSQLMEARGLRGPDKYLPHMLGHEGTGVVVEVGPQTNKFTPGEEVVLGWVKGDGLEGGAKTYHSDCLGRINAGSITTFSNYSIVSENRLYRKPITTPDHLAVLYGCALPTGVGLVLNELKPDLETTICVLGLGGIGMSALMAALEFRPSKLIAIDTEYEKLELARSLGATDILEANDKNLLDKIEKITHGRGVQYCIEAAGLVETIELGFSIIRKNDGQLIFASHPKAGDKIRIDPFELICGKSIKGSWGGGSNPDTDIELMGRMYESGKLRLDKLISHSFDLNNINDALLALEQRKIVRALIDVNS